MHAAEWVGLVSPVIVLGGAAVAAVAKLTRMTVVLEALGRDMRAIVGRIDDHEARLFELERNARGRHRFH
jgi:hypothetical protein